jgi:hypothetical protein
MVPPQQRSGFGDQKEIAVKKYVVTLSDEERGQLNAMISKGKHPARKLLKARIRSREPASIWLKKAWTGL